MPSSASPAGALQRQAKGARAACSRYGQRSRLERAVNGHNRQQRSQLPPCSPTHPASPTAQGPGHLRRGQGPGVWQPRGVARGVCGRPAGWRRRAAQPAAHRFRGLPSRVHPLARPAGRAAGGARHRAWQRVSEQVGAGRQAGRQGDQLPELPEPPRPSRTSSRLPSPLAACRPSSPSAAAPLATALQATRACRLAPWWQP